ncbi:MAG: major capsid protein [Halobacteria archaeon]|nr:major capsid protein [Halobacteria archaeon]
MSAKPTELIDDGPAEVSSAGNLEGGSGIGYQKLVAHSQYRLAQYRGDEDLARQAKQVLAAYQKQVFQEGFSTNDQLRKDEWKRMNDVLTAVARDNTLGLDTLRDRGIEVPLDLGVLRFEWEDVDDFGEADVDMAATAGGNEDTLDFANNGIPLPIVHKSFRLNLRKLRSSRNRGQPLDAAGVEAATAAVTRKLEDILYGGNSITVDGDSIAGFTDFADRQSVSANQAWSGASSDEMIDDVLRTVSALEDAKALPGQSGYDFLIARQNYQEIRGKNAGTDDKRGVLQLLRDRLEQEEALPSQVRFFPVDRLSEGNAIMVKPTERYVQLPMPADIQTVQWESMGGMVQHWKVMGAVFPALRADQQGNSGVAHLSGI